jgi:cytidine deaminase
MDEIVSKLIDAAQGVCGEFDLEENFSVASVGAAIRTADGNIYTGVCIDLACGLGFCAEVSAIAEMLKHRETWITDVVAVTNDNILPPCGRCREMISQIDRRNLDCRVILGEDSTTTLRQLLPDHWLYTTEDTE